MFLFVNRYKDTVWLGVLSSACSPRLEPTGFELPLRGTCIVGTIGLVTWSGSMWVHICYSQPPRTAVP